MAVASAVDRASEHPNKRPAAVAGETAVRLPAVRAPEARAELRYAAPAARGKDVEHVFHAAVRTFDGAASYLPEAGERQNGSHEEANDIDRRSEYVKHAEASQPRDCDAGPRRHFLTPRSRSSWSTPPAARGFFATPAGGTAPPSTISASHLAMSSAAVFAAIVERAAISRRKTLRKSSVELIETSGTSTARSGRALCPFT